MVPDVAVNVNVYVPGGVPLGSGGGGGVGVDSVPQLATSRIAIKSTTRNPDLATRIDFR